MPDPLLFQAQLVDAEPEREQPRAPLASSSLVTAGGLVLGLAGVALALLGARFLDHRFAFREAGSILAALGIPLLFLGLLLGHEARAWNRALALGGLLLCAAGMFGFSLVYPRHFNVPEGDRSIVPVVTYSLGLALVAGASFAALVADYVRRHAAAGAKKDDAEPLSRADIDADISEALGKWRYSWGGVRERGGEAIKVRVHDEKVQVLSGKFGRDSSGAWAPAAQSLARLRAFRGGRVREGELKLEPATSAAAALRALRADPERPAYRPSLWSRLRGWLAR